VLSSVLTHTGKRNSKLKTAPPACPQR
jgi:hypothetical protein